MPRDQMSALSIQNLKFRYPDQPAGAPWNVSVSSLEVARGEQVLLTAASGHGKSTLLQVVAGLL
ncbi:MAG: hypothetical protein L6Q35_17135, partial [Phycisphaerales bacterium]|nr:hypothetical protein [Phycisphaerales bacterium]